MVPGACRRCNARLTAFLRILKDVHLKNLTLRGFKSFASATTLRLEPGITCVVGPNGSGKSNVVDALAWVMGEQGAKTLRGGQMADIIFAGTSSRAPLGRAQVDLTIDNTDRALPIDYSEVTISRTLFRGGGSEYAINGTPARLLDVQELLSDTGMGRQMHVIVGQGQLDQILSSTPEERRGFIEEAAGVLKHRRRKERALRKLEQMDQNLVRVLDLTQEIHRQLGPLARQAATARRAQSIQARVRDAKARLIADEIVDLRDRLNAHDESDQMRTQKTQELRVQARELTESIQLCEQREREADPRLTEANTAWRDLTAIGESLRATVLMTRDKIASLERPLDAPSGDDPDELDRRADEASAEDAELLRTVEECRRRLQEAISAREEAEQRDEEAHGRLSGITRQIADRREKIARLTGDVESARSRLVAAEAEENRAEELVRAARKRQEEAEKALQKTPAPDGEGSEDTAARNHSQASVKRDEARSQVDALVAREREARAERARWESRRDTLAEQLAPDDATSTLAGRSGVLGTVPEALTIEPGWEDAIAAALFPLADAAIVDGTANGIDCLRHAREHQQGQMRMMRAGDGDGNNEVEQQPRGPLPSGARWALDVITHAHSVSRSVTKLLESVVVCRDLDEVQDLLEHPGVRTVVTSNGDVVTGESLIGSGHSTSSVLSVRAQYEQAVEGARHALDDEQKASEQLVHANEVLDQAIRAANEALKALRAQDSQRAKLAEAYARAQSAAKAAQAETQRCEATARKVAEHVQWARSQVDTADERLSTSKDMEPAPDAEPAQQRAGEAARITREAREHETATRLELRTNEERSRQSGGRARALRQAAARSREERSRYAQREDQRRRKLLIAQRVAEQAQYGVDVAARIVEHWEQLRAEAESLRQQSSHERIELRAALDAVNAEIAEITGLAHQDEIARAQTMMRLEQATARSMEELSLEADQLIEEFGPHNLVPDFSGEGDPTAFSRPEQEKALAAAERDLAKLGRVNPLALEEHEALSKRHEFLVSQVNDLKSSKADLLHIIDDVDRLVEEAFTTAFNDTREQFAHTFEVLFPNGEGNLTLTDPDSMLTTGIEIEARPAGKKVKRLSLLSGGERSLAALAFLIAIFKARPSPFYVMDEVEAALDDVNLTRLLKIFRELQEESQLIVITHQKRTMEIADALYGVTMRDGVTTVVSQRLADA